jgi:T5orf172 domain
MEACYLYVIQEADDSHFKIGVAGHPARRLSDLQAGNRRRLSVKAAYAGTRANCLYIEKVALKYFRASAGSEWVYAESLPEISEFIDAFCEDSK